MHCLVSFAGEKFLIFCGLVGRSQLQMFCKVVILKISFKIFEKYFEEVESRQKVWKYVNNEQRSVAFQWLDARFTQLFGIYLIIVQNYIFIN